MGEEKSEDRSSRFSKRKQRHRHLVCQSTYPRAGRGSRLQQRNWYLYLNDYGRKRSRNRRRKCCQQIGAEQLAKVIDAIRAGNAYVHTNLSTGGEIRGQIYAARKR